MIIPIIPVINLLSPHDPRTPTIEVTLTIKFGHDPSYKWLLCSYSCCLKLLLGASNNKINGNTSSSNHSNNNSSSSNHNTVSGTSTCAVLTAALWRKAEVMRLPLREGNEVSQK